MEDLQELLIKGVSIDVICDFLDMPEETLGDRKIKNEFTDVELSKLKKLNFKYI